MKLRNFLFACLAALTPSLAVAQSFPTKGAHPYSAIVPGTTATGILIKGAAGVVLNVQLGGIASAPVWVKFYDKATAPVCGTDDALIVKRLILPAAATAANGDGSNVPLPAAVQFKLGIGYCAVTGIADGNTTAPSANTAVVNIDWN